MRSTAQPRLCLDPFDGSTPTYDANAFAQAMALFDDPGLAIST